MLTIFANLRINDQQRLQRFKDSFLSFKDIASDDWLINIRGTYRDEALAFLKDHLGRRGTFFELLDDERGWITNALDMLPHAKYDYVLLWVEDHLNLVPLNLYRKMIEEMSKGNADYMMYSWWVFGEARHGFDELDLEKGETIDTVYLTPKKWKKILQSGYKNYLISAVGIFKKSFLRKLMLKDRWMLPMFWAKNVYRILVGLSYIGFTFDRKKVFHSLNKMFFRNKLPRFPKETPFNLEKGPWRTDILPIKIALPKQELFACIDDDLGTPGYQLIKRGLYPTSANLSVFDTASLRRDGEISEKIIEQNPDYTATAVYLPKGQNYGKVYYQNLNRIPHLLRKTLTVLKGELEIASADQTLVLRPGQVISIFPNLKHAIIARKDSIFVASFSNLPNHNKDIKA